MSDWSVVWGWSRNVGAAHAFFSVNGQTGSSVCGVLASAACLGTPAKHRCANCVRLLELHGLTPKPPAVAEG